VKQIEQMLYTTLSADNALKGLAPGGVWRGVAPTDTTGVWVVFSLVSELDVYTFKIRGMVESFYQIKAIAPGESSSGAWSAAERVENLLTDKALTITSGRLLMIRRQQIISLTETDGGEQYQHAGGIYAITVQE
jgi:hypothetical protein